MAGQGPPPSMYVFQSSSIPCSLPLEASFAAHASNRDDTYTSLVQDVARAVETAANAPASTDAASLAPSRTYWVAVCGAPASGKTTLTQQVGRRLNEEQHIPTIILPMDGYHFYKHELDTMPDPEAMHVRRGAPWTFNAAKFVRDLKEARQTGTGSFPSFDHHHGDPIEDEIQLLSTHKVVLVEGNYLSLSSSPWCELKELFDARWYVDCPSEVARARVIGRHLSTGNTEEDATRRADENDVPNGALVQSETLANEWATRVVLSK